VKVLIWACEDTHDELWRRQAAVCRYFDMPMAELEGRVTIEPRRGMDNTLLSLAYGAPCGRRTFDELREQVNDYGASVLFLDNIGQTFGGNENNRHHVTTFCNGLAGLAADFSPVIMGHPAKAIDSEFAGSGAWENAVRMRWYMGYKLPDQEPEENPDTNVRYLAKRKTNYSEKDYRKLIWQDGLFVQEQRNVVLRSAAEPSLCVWTRRKRACSPPSIASRSPASASPTAGPRPTTCRRRCAK
jgi:RecA-family ATPase